MSRFGKFAGSISGDRKGRLYFACATVAQPVHWMRQAFFVGRPKLPISRVVENMQANERSLEEAVQDCSLPVAALEEALDYSQRFHDLVLADATDELALSDELARRPAQIP